MLWLLDLPDSLKGMRRYTEHLKLNEAQDTEQRETLWRQYCRGWFIGSTEEKQAWAMELEKEHPGIEWEGDMAELNEAHWEKIVKKELRKYKKGERELKNDLKGARYKVRIAQRLRRETTADNPWIANRLNMGHPSRVTNLIRTL